MPAAPEKTISLYEAKTHLSALVEEAALGREVVITKNGRARAKLVPVNEPVMPKGKRVPSGELKVSFIAEDFDAPDAETERLWGFRD